MSIVITILKYPEGVSNTKASHTFSLEGGTIGRAPDNQWVLEDPERFISGRHSQITEENGQYFLTDLSTNGTFFNGSAEPIGKGSMVALKDGDRFSLSDYEFQVSLMNASQDMGASPFGQDFGADPFASLDDGADFFDTPADSDTFGGSGGHIPSSEPIFNTSPEETDPLAVLDKMGQSSNPAGYSSDVYGPPTQYGVQSNPMNEAVEWPSATLESGGIPENWDDDLTSNNFSQHSPNNIPDVNPASNAPGNSRSSFTNDIADQIERSENQQYSLEDVADTIDRLESEKYTLEKTNLKLQAEIVRLKQPGAHSVTQMDEILIEALGLGGRKLDKKKVAEISQVVGALVRETIVGMMRVLTSRSSIKNEFRMNVTTIQPVENNPLKFSANVEDAIENMFLRSGNSYMKPVDAIREGFEGIGEHQVAILAGIRSAFKSVIEKFDPSTLEQRFEKFNKGNFIPGMNKAKNWELYSEYYNDLINDMDSSFQNLFGHEFVAAYEDQLQKLSLSRKSN